MTNVTEPRIDPDRMIFEGVDTYREVKDKKGRTKVKGPIFTVSEMGKFFFARTNHWVRWIEASGRMAKVTKKRCAVCHGDRVVKVGVDKNDKPKFDRCPNCTEPVGARRDPTMGNRIYTLSDVEEIAHALAANGSISGAQLRHTLRTLMAQGEMNEIL